MKTYRWKGIEKNGEYIYGTTMAMSKNALATELSKNNIIFLSCIKEISLRSFNKRISKKEIIDFSREFSLLLKSGMPLRKILDIQIDTSHTTMNKLLMEISRGIDAGRTLSCTLRDLPEYFDDLYCGLLEAAERSGTLAETFNIIANQQERLLNFKNKVIKALIYPLAVLFTSILITIGLLIFVIPQFESIYQGFGAQLPPLTLIIINFSQRIRIYGWWLLSCLVIISIALQFALKRSVIIKKFLNRWVLKIPILGTLVKTSVIGRFTLGLGTLTASGIPLIQALQSSLSLLQNQVFEEALKKIKRDVTTGLSLYHAMSSHDCFPKRITQMIAVGENSGNLAEILKRISESYHSSLELQLDHLSKLMEPVIMLLLAIIIGFLIIAMYLPIFKMSSVV